MAEAFEKIDNPGGAYNRVVGPTLASAGTIAPTFGINPVSGTTAIKTITPPYTGFAGQIILLPTGAFTIATTTASPDNVLGVSVQAVANVPIICVYDGSYWYCK